MTDPAPDAWTEQMTGRERVRAVVETLDEPATITSIAHEADVAWETSKSELERLVAENLVAEHQGEGETTYGPNPVRLFLDEIVALIDEHDREELETQLIEYQSQIEDLRSEHEADSAEKLRQQLADEELTVDEMRAIRNIASTWEALETEVRLYKHALHFYDDITRLSNASDAQAVSV